MSKPRIIGSQQPRDVADAAEMLAGYAARAPLTVVPAGGTATTRACRVYAIETTTTGPCLLEVTRLVAMVGHLPYQDEDPSGLTPGAIVLTQRHAGGPWEMRANAQIARAVQRALDAACVSRPAPVVVAL